MKAKLALDGGVPVRTQPYPAWPQWDEREEAAVLAVVRSGEWWAPGGTQVKKLQEEFAAYHDARYGVAVTNCSAALEVCLRAANIGLGDEVITTPFTFIATANTISHCGARPVFVDIDPRTYDLRQGDRETRRQGDFTLSPPLPLSLSQFGGMGSLWLPEFFPHQEPGGLWRWGDGGDQRCGAGREG